VQSLGLVTQEMPNPIQQEFALILSQNKLGVPLEEAFTNLEPDQVGRCRNVRHFGQHPEGDGR